MKQGAVMTGKFRLNRPAACWVRLASLLVPPNTRREWCRRYESDLHAIAVLDDRGELAGEGPFLTAWLCRHAIGDAFLIRRGGCAPSNWLRSPVFLMAAAALMVVVFGACTHGFEVSRSLIVAFRGHISSVNENRLIANLFPLAFAIATAAMAAWGRISLRGRGKMYLSFLVLKMLLLVALLFPLWIEGGGALRAHIANQAVRVMLGGLVFAVAFIAFFAWAVMWSLADQQHRCPVCLRRLVLPVSIGSWASVFDPAATEWICEAGHGSLCMSDIENGEPGHWVQGEVELSLPK